MAIIWSDRLKTGIEIIDEQHRFIIDALSGIEVHKLKKNDFLKLALELEAYLCVHFTVEEDYMKDVDYPDFKSHKANHDRVLADYKSMLEQHKYDVDQSILAVELVSYMEVWFIDHYANEDAKMVQYFKKNNWKINK